MQPQRQYLFYSFTSTFKLTALKILLTFLTKHCNVRDILNYEFIKMQALVIHSGYMFFFFFFDSYVFAVSLYNIVFFDNITMH